MYQSHEAKDNVSYTNEVTTVKRTPAAYMNRVAFNAELDRIAKIEGTVASIVAKVNWSSFLF